MTIKEFSKLCNCNPQTLRYYDKEDLLKPKEVDTWTGYRYYSEEQALDFVKIKNLQEADFSIKEIKEMLLKSDEEIYKAFDEKVQEQITKLERIKKIQATYLSEKQKMEATIREIKEKVLAAAKEYDPQEEFGISAEYYDRLMGRVNDLFEASINNIETMDVDFSDVEFTDFDSNGPGVHAGKEIAEEENYQNPLGNDAYQIIYEKHNWNKTKEVLAELPEFGNGEYMLYFELVKSKIGNMNMAFCNVILGYVLDKNAGKTLQLNCNITDSKDGQNHFWLLTVK